MCGFGTRNRTCQVCYFRRSSKSHNPSVWLRALLEIAHTKGRHARLGYVPALSHTPKAGTRQCDRRRLSSPRPFSGRCRPAVPDLPFLRPFGLVLGLVAGEATSSPPPSQCQQTQNRKHSRPFLEPVTFVFAGHSSAPSLSFFLALTPLPLPLHHRAGSPSQSTIQPRGLEPQFLVAPQGRRPCVSNWKPSDSNP